MFIRVNDDDFVNTNYITRVDYGFFDMRIHIVNEKDSIYVNQEYMKNVLDTLGIPEYTRDEWERRKEKARMFSEKLKNRR